MRHLHLFDFDGTLTRHDSFTGFIRHVHGMRGLIRVLLQSSWAIILWKTGFRSNTYAKLHMFAAAFKGMDAEEFRNAGKTYADKINRMVGARTVLTTEAETGGNGRLTGRFSRPNCQCGEKARRILEAYPELKSNRSEFFVTAYGDSDGDNEMLELADEKIRVTHQ